MSPTNPHPPWCARGHHCGIHLDEHRAHPITLDLPDRGRAVLTRIRTGGTDRAEIRITIQLADRRIHRPTATGRPAPRPEHPAHPHHHADQAGCPMTCLDWRHHSIGSPRACRYCYQPALMRDETGLPCHKVCAELRAAGLVVGDGAQGAAPTQLFRLPATPDARVVRRRAA